MHDPMTVAFDIRSPFKQASPLFPKGYREHLITIWHVDPQRDGSDDSCGWSFVRLTPRQIERLKNAAWMEGRDPYFLRMQSQEWKGSRHEAEAIYRGMILFVCQVLRLPMTFEEAAKLAATTIHKPDCVDSAGALCFLPGYHTNSQEDRPEAREDVFFRRMRGIAFEVLTARRPWYRHPRWHVWHWKIQIHPVQKFKRWAFSRCAKCGQRFSWGYAPTTGQWSGGGARWFRSEAHVYHRNCYPGSGSGVTVHPSSASSSEAK